MAKSQFTYHGRPYDFRVLAANFKQVKRKLPRAMGQIAVNFFKDRYREQGWNRTGMLIPWRKRKVEGRGRRRAILVKSGAMRNKTRIEQATFEHTSIVNDQPQAVAHNEGFKGSVQVKRHARTATKKIRVKSSNIATRRVRTGKKKVQGENHSVKAHSRKMNLPKRQFIGNSKVLNNKLDGAVEKMMTNISKP